jgi:hypothetical protein
MSGSHVEIASWRYVLSNSMEQSTSWETDSDSTSQEIPRLLRNPKVHHCVDSGTPGSRIIFCNKLAFKVWSCKPLVSPSGWGTTTTTATIIIIIIIIIIIVIPLTRI